MERLERADEAVPRPAATVVLLRDSPAGLEVLVTERPKGLRFMGGATVFPGGAVTRADLDPRWEGASAIDRPTAVLALPGMEPAAALGAFVCALREAFEEVGFPAGAGDEVASLTRRDADEPARWLDRCLELGVVLATDTLVPAGRWVTPLGSPIRFDTRFFVAPVPDGWEPDPDPGEVAACRWTIPRDVLDELAEGRATMAPPTIEMLTRVARAGSVADALSSLDVPAPSGESPVVRVSPLVQVVVAPNPGLMTGPGTNTYVVGSGPTCVIDPATDDPPFLASIERAGAPIQSLLVTHRHPDHVGGVTALAARTGAEVRAFGPDAADGIAVVPLEDGGVVDVAGVSLRALHTPGHAQDHLCFLLEGLCSLFSGDHILGRGTPVIAPPEGDLALYLKSLERLRTLELDRIFPGHWETLDGGGEVVSAYLAHRAERESSIVEALRDGPMTVAQLVASVYRDTPAELHVLAEQTLGAHLELLTARERVEERAGRWILRDVERAHNMS